MSPCQAMARGVTVDLPGLESGYGPPLSVKSSAADAAADALVS